MFFGPPCGVTKSLHDVLAFQVGVVSKNLIDALPRANLSDDHADGYAHSTDARLSAHHRGVLGYAIQLLHSLLLIKSHCHGSVLGMLFQREVDEVANTSCGQTTPVRRNGLPERHPRLKFLRPILG